MVHSEGSSRMPRRNGAEREAPNKPLFYAPAILLSNRRFRNSSLSNDFEDREKSRFLFRFRWTIDEYKTILSRSSNVFLFFSYRQFVTLTEDSIKKIHVIIRSLSFREMHDDCIFFLLHRCRTLNRRNRRGFRRDRTTTRSRLN